MTSSSIVAFLAGRHGIAVLEELLRLGDTPRLVVTFRASDHEEDHNSLIVDQCKARGIEYGWHEEVRERLPELLRPEDRLLFIKWRFLFPDAVLDKLERLPFVIHDSLLPKYRGFAPLNWAIICGERELGATLFEMRPEIDSGPVVAQGRFELGTDETVREAEERVVQVYRDLIRNHLPGALDGTVELVEQDHAAATYTCARTPEDGEIDWSWPARRIHNLVRALTKPFPGAFTKFKGERLWIWSAEVLEDEDRYGSCRIPGRIVRVEKGRGLHVLTGRGILLLKQVGFGSDAKLAPDQLIRSVRCRLGR